MEHLGLKVSPGGPIEEIVTRLLVLCVVLVGAARTAAAAPGRIGVMLDAGVPDGGHASLVVRPARWMNLHAGVGTNLISSGVRAGATLYLLPTRVAPSLNLDVGRFPAGNANRVARRLELIGEDHPLLREVGYDYGVLHLGIDFGREDLTFYLHAGATWVRGRVRNLEETLAEGREDGVTVEVRQDPILTAVGPSARLGFLVYF